MRALHSRIFGVVYMYTYIMAVGLLSGVSSCDIPASSARGDCTDILANSFGNPIYSGKYLLLVGEGKRPVFAYCDMATDGGGWTVFQRRTTGALNFSKSWSDYEDGFENVIGDVWLGLKYLHSITAGKRYVMRVEYSDWQGRTHYAEYDDFKVGGSGCKYTLESLGNYCGDCGDSLRIPTVFHLGMKFTTFDQDNDLNDQYCCATFYKGGWWYNNCLGANLNGEYKLNGNHTSYADGLEWATCAGLYYSFMTTKMMIRPYAF